MSKKRQRYSAEYRFKVALEAAKGTKTLAESASETGVHPNQISQWKGQFLEGGAHVFSSNGARRQREFEKLEAELYEQIGRLKMELEWPKKNCLLRLRPCGHDRAPPSGHQYSPTM